MADDPTLDPRFDPAFQRGFEGTVGPTRRRAPVGTPSVLPAQEVAARPTVVEPVERVAVPVERVDPGERRVVVAEQQSERPTPPSSELEEEPTQRRANPFIVALIVIAIVLIGAGIAGAQFANAAFQTNLTTSVSYVTVLLVIASSAVSVGLGVATLVGIVFLFAARSLRR